MTKLAGILADLAPVAEEEVAQNALDKRLRGANEPFVVRAIASNWPLVRAGRNGEAAARHYILSHARDRLFETQIGQPGAERVFYDDRMNLDFRCEKLPLSEAFTLFDQASAKESPPLIYLPSIEIDSYFEGLGHANRLPLGNRSSRDGIWIGGRTRIAAHNDIAQNIAVCAVGRRRFILFPPDQFANLYLGPLDHSPGGRPVSMVNFAVPDWEAHPRFRTALDHGQVAQLEPGDALFIPAGWYHHVEGLEPFNVLINSWWNEEPRFLGHPEDALYHAILAIRDLPADSRDHWRSVFDHYVFSGGEIAAGHVPESARGVLAPLDAPQAQKLRNYLLRRLAQ